MTIELAVEAENVDICVKRYDNKDFKGSIVSPGFPENDFNGNYQCRCTLSSEEDFKLIRKEGYWYALTIGKMLLSYNETKYALNVIPDEIVTSKLRVKVYLVYKTYYY